MSWRTSLCCLQAGGDRAGKEGSHFVEQPWHVSLVISLSRRRWRGDVEREAGKDSGYRLGFSGAIVGPKMGMP